MQIPQITHKLLRGGEGNWGEGDERGTIDLINATQWLCTHTIWKARTLMRIIISSQPFNTVRRGSQVIFVCGELIN
jgi:hypothetical protein